MFSLAVRLDLKQVEEDVSMKDAECVRLSEEIKSLKDKLQKSQLELTKLHLLDSAQEETKRVREQLEKSQQMYDSTLQKWNSSQLEVVALDDKLKVCQLELHRTKSELGGVTSDRDELRLEVASMEAAAARREAEHGQQVKGGH